LVTAQEFVQIEENVSIVDQKIASWKTVIKNLHVAIAKKITKLLHKNVKYSRKFLIKESLPIPCNIFYKTTIMKILFINAQSFRTAYGLSDLVDNYNIDIMCLNETFESQHASIKFRDWEAFKSARPNQSRGGAAIFVKPNVNYITKRIPNLELKNIEMVCINMTDKQNKSINIWCPYVPPDKDDLMANLCDHINKNKQNNMILLGDLNAKSYEWNNRKTNKHGKLLEESIANNNLICVNDGQATRRQCQSVIDLVIVSQDYYQNVLDCTTLSHERVQSDHIAVYTQVDFATSQEEEIENESRWNIRKCNWSEWTVATNDIFADYELNYNDNFGDIYQNFEDKLIQCMDKTIPKTKSKNKSHISRPLWWNEECREMKNKLNGAQRAFRKRNTPDNLKLLKELEEKN